MNPRSILACLLVACLSLSFSFAQESDQDEAMKAWLKAATPGEPHKWLAKMAGSWTTTSISNGQESKGTHEAKMVLGGRFVQFDHRSKVMGMEFQGLGTLGYDNVKGRFVTTWASNMSTHILSAEGSWNDAKDAITLAGTYVDPIGGKVTMGFRWTWTMKSDDAMTFEMWEVPPPDKGKEYKALTVEYARAR